MRVHVCVCVFIKLHMTALSSPVVLAILCHSRSNPPSYPNHYYMLLELFVFVCVSMLLVFIILHITTESPPALPP